METEGVVFFSKTNGQIGGKSDCDELPETPFNGSRRLRGGGSSYARERPSVNGRRRGFWSLRVEDYFCENVYFW
ncbi:MAG: hypothetical protein ACTS5A_03810 [Candidatus Hodgkinia cicadicola]